MLQLPYFRNAEFVTEFEFRKRVAKAGYLFRVPLYIARYFIIANIVANAKYLQ